MIWKCSAWLRVIIEQGNQEDWIIFKISKREGGGKWDNLEALKQFLNHQKHKSSDEVLEMECLRGATHVNVMKHLRRDGDIGYASQEGELLNL